MSEEFKRVELDANECEEVAGGKLRWPRDEVNGCWLCYSTAKPSKKYIVAYDADSCLAIQEYALLDLNGMSDTEKIANMLSKGWLRELPAGFTTKIQ